MSQKQENWKWCSKCACVFFGGDALCRANDGVHDFSASSMYAISNQANAPGQNKWKWCKKCQVLSYTGDTIGACQAGGRMYCPSHHPLSPPPWRQCVSL